MDQLTFWCKIILKQVFLFFLNTSIFLNFISLTKEMYTLDQNRPNQVLKVPMLWQVKKNKTAVRKLQVEEGELPVVIVR